MNSTDNIQQAKQRLASSLATRTRNVEVLDEALRALAIGVQTWRGDGAAIRAALFESLRQVTGADEAAQLVDEIAGNEISEERLAMTIAFGVFSALSPDAKRAGAPSAVASSRQMGDSILERIEQLTEPVNVE